jgi:hypothetical protein
VSFGASFRLCAALAALMLPLFPGCLNPRPEEDPQVVDVLPAPGQTASGGAGGSGNGVYDPGDSNEVPGDNSNPSSPAPGQPDAGVPDGGVPPDGGGCDRDAVPEEAPDAGPTSDAAPPG